MGLAKGALRGKGIRGGVGVAPLRVPCSLIYDLSGFRIDTRKLVSLHQAHPSHKYFTNSEVDSKRGKNKKKREKKR
jgi:hypothetical protein